MTDRNETERAIEVLQVFKDNEYNLPLSVCRAINRAVSALKSQSEAERKIERVREYCKQQILENGEESKVWGISDEEISNINGKMDILYCISLILDTELSGNSERLDGNS